MDGDDIALPSRLEKQLRYLKANPDIAIVGCATTAIDTDSNPIPGLGASTKPITPQQVARTMLLASPCLHIWMARTEVYEQLEGYRNMATAEDYDFLLRATSLGYGISNLEELLMLIRQRPGNISSCIEQRKAHYYIGRLCRERRRSGKDSFTPEHYKRALRSGRIEKAAFQAAVGCAQIGLRSYSRIRRYAFLILSVLLSPWQARYFFDRLRFRIAMRSAADATSALQEHRI